MSRVTGNRASRDSDAEALDTFGGGSRRRRHRLEASAGFGDMSGDLFDQHHAGDAARLRKILQGDVVGDYDGFDPQALGAGAFDGEAEIEPVARIVLDDDKASGGPSHGQDGLE